MEKGEAACPGYGLRCAPVSRDARLRLASPASATPRRRKPPDRQPSMRLSAVDPRLPIRPRSQEPGRATRIKVATSSSPELTSPGPSCNRRCRSASCAPRTRRTSLAIRCTTRCCSIPRSGRGSASSTPAGRSSTKASPTSTCATWARTARWCWSTGSAGCRAARAPRRSTSTPSPRR